ncbi:hypothetical protein COU79_01885 [Candidatus Peregrinibacteria bacterium CG10_big_fil_rev_8_21_14_0_10_54_7]|nr:MAG: hypothetical protein COU79_01885 [Candidatus Peregrinibacteria bacterium CG10_big_fil_rev_8_21_14_0_10_54_7]
MKKRYNDPMKRIAASALCVGLLLSACSSEAKNAETAEEPLRVFSPQLGVASSYVLANRAQKLPHATRPSPTMGIFTSSYLAQGAFVSVQAAMIGIQSQQRLLTGQSLPATSETFALLQELGTVLQVDIADMLNRSGNRGEALDTYIETLQGIGNISVRKQKELEQQTDSFSTQVKEERSTVRELESSLRKILRNEDYGRAATVQEQLTGAQAQLAQTEAKLDQAKDVLDRFDELLEIAEERLTAIGNNREVLIAGLRVLDVPGIEDLGILDQGKPFRRSKSKSGENDDVFGSEFIQKK